MRIPCPLSLAALLLLLAGGGLTPLHAEEAPSRPRLELKDLHGGRSFTQGIPSWRWRPGHAELVQRQTRPVAGAQPTSVLVSMDPLSGATHDLIDLGALHALVPGRGRRMRGIGRAGPPSFRWAPDGRALCAVVKGDLVWVDLTSTRRRRLTRTEEPLTDLNVAPDGSHVSFARGNELWVVPTKAGAPYPLTTGGSRTLLNGTLDWVYPEEFDFRTAAWWAPDARHLAYLQMDQSDVPVYRVPGLLPLRSEGREMFYPKAGDPNPRVRVGVVPVAGGPTVWMQLGTPAPEYIVRVAWLETGAAEVPHVLLIVTLDRAQRHLQLHVCDPSTGASRIAHEERDEAWIDAPPAPRPIGPRRFLWRRQVDCTRWYAAELSADLARLSLAPLSAEGIEAGALLHHDPRTGETLYAGTRRGASSGQVFLRDAAGKEGPASFCPDPDRDVQAAPDAAGDLALVTTQDAVTPPTTRLVRVADGEVLRTIGTATTERYEALDVVVPEYGRIPIEGLGDIRWRLWKPADFDPARSYGLIVNVYAGPGSRMVRNRFGRGPLLATLLAQRGFLTLEVDGRGTRGQGRAFLKSVQGRLGLQELEDQVRAVQALSTRPYIDGDRVGIWGWSYGGTMACNALTMRSDVFRAGVAVASVTDWRLYDTIYTERYMGTPKENPKGYAETSCITHVKKMDGQLLLLHGLGDDNVHAQNTIRLVEALLQAKKQNFDLMLYPRRGHGIGGATLDVFTRLVRHFETHLAPR